jgi:hypothetical protein
LSNAMSVAQAEKKMRLKNVMYATDFSHAADVAFPYAASSRDDLARSFMRETAHLYEYLPVRQNREPLLMPTREGGSRFASFLAKRSEYRGLSLEGAVWPASTAIRDKQIDLLVRRSRERLGETPVGFGGRRSCAVCAVSCTVLTVGPRAPSEPPFEGQVSEILYATDLSEASAAAAPYVMTVAREQGAGLSVVHVIRKLPANGSLRPDELEAA